MDIRTSKRNCRHSVIFKAQSLSPLNYLVINRKIFRRADKAGQIGSTAPADGQRGADKSQPCLHLMTPADSQIRAPTAEEIKYSRAD